MGGYSPTGPWVNLSSPGIDQNFLNRLENVLYRRSGDTETGKYFLTAPAHAGAASIGAYMQSMSRSASPVSVTSDTTDQSPLNCGTPARDHLGSNGFHIFTTSSGAALACNAGGNFTITF